MSTQEITIALNSVRNAILDANNIPESQVFRAISIDQIAQTGKFADFKNAFDEKKEELINAMTDEKIPEDLAIEIFQKLKNAVVRDAETQNRTTASSVNDIAILNQKSLAEAIEKIIKQEEDSNAGLKGSFRRALRMILDIMNVPENAISNASLSDITPSKIAETARNTVRTESG